MIFSTVLITINQYNATPGIGPRAFASRLINLEKYTVVYLGRLSSGLNLQKTKILNKNKQRKTLVVVAVWQTVLAN